MREQTPEALAAIIEQAMEAEALRAEVDALAARCTALAQDRDQAADEVRVRGELISELQTRCQHLEQAVKIGRMFAVKLRAKV